MCFVYITELRKATIPIFFDMMSFEFNEIDSTTGKIKGNFSQVLLCELIRNTLVAA